MQHSNTNNRFVGKTILIFIATLILSFVLIPSSVASAKTFEQMNVGEQANTYLYYKALISCSKEFQLSKHVLDNNRLTLPDAYNFNWFVEESLTNPDPSIALETNGFIVPDKGLNLVCGNNQSIDWIRDAMTNQNYWGYQNGLDSVCEFGLKRMRSLETEVDCKSGKDADGKVDENNDLLFSRNGDQKMDTGQIITTLTDRMAPNSGGISLTDSIKYSLYYKAFKSACAGNETTTEDDNIYIIKYIDPTNGEVSNKTYSAASPDNQKVAFYLGDGTTRETTTCGAMANVLQDTELATTYSEDVQANLTDSTISRESDTVGEGYSQISEEGTPTCGSEVPALGWLICPMISGLSAMNDGMWSLVSNLLKTDPLKQSDNIYSAWGVIRNLANIAFVVAFLIIIFSQLSNIGVSNYGIKKLLPKIIISAILVNLSFIIVQIAVDLANIVGSSLYNVLVGLLGKADPPTYVVFFDLLLAGLAGGAGFTASTIIIAGGASTLFWMMLPILLIAALGFLAALFTLGFRSAAIPILAILSPLAFVAYLLPNTESWFKKWRDMFIKMLMLYPLAALVFGGAVFASSAIIGKDNLNWWNYLIGLIVMALPLFSLPFLAAKGGDILSKANGAFMGLANKAKSPIGKWTGRHGGLANSRANNSAINDDRLNKNGRPKSRRTRYLQRRARFDAINKNQQNEYGRAQSDYIANQAESNTSFRQKLSGGAGEAGQQRALASAISVQNKLESDEVSAAKIVFKHAGLNGNDIQELALKGKLRLAGENGTIKTYSGKAMQRAAIEEKMSAGSMDEIHKIIGESGESLSEFRGVIATGMVTNKLSTKDPSLGGKRIDDTGKGEIKGFKGMHKVRLEAIKQGKYTSEALTTMDDKAREEAIYSAEYENTNNNNSAYLEILKNAASGIIGTETTPGYLELQNKIKGNNLATAQINDLANSNSRTSKMEEKEIKQRNEQLK